MLQGYGFNDDVKIEIQRFLDLESISQNDILESVDKIRELCKKYARCESDAIVSAFSSDAFKRVITWDYVWFIANSSSDELYIISVIVKILKNNSLFYSLRSESPLCFYYANLFLWRYGEIIFPLRNPEGVNARLILLDALLRFEMNEVCLGLTEDILRICEYVEDDMYYDILSVLRNNLDIITNITPMHGGGIFRNAKELLTLIAGD